MKAVPFYVVTPNVAPKAMDAIAAAPVRKPCPLCGKFEADGELHAVYRCEGAVKDLAGVFQRPDQNSK